MDCPKRPIVRVVALATCCVLLLCSAVASADSDSGTEPERREHFRVGALASAGFPRPLSVEGMLKIERVLGLGAEYGMMPKMTFGGVDVHAWSVAGDARIFPFKGAFFFGMRAGLQHVGAQSTLTIPTYGSVTESQNVDTWFVNPRMGLLWTFDFGLSVGLDAGVQIPLGSSTTSSLPAQVASLTGVPNVTDKLTKTPLPTVDLLQLGMLF